MTTCLDYSGLLLGGISFSVFVIATPKICVVELSLVVVALFTVLYLKGGPWAVGLGLLGVIVGGQWRLAPIAQGTCLE